MNLSNEYVRLKTRRAFSTILVLLAARDFAQACSCIPITVMEAVRRADIVFRGTVVEIRDAPIELPIRIAPPESYKRLVIFRVSRVWKGEVGETFEMPAVENPGGLCYGFAKGLLATGNDLLVYANRSSATGQYSTSLCSHTALASRTHDIVQLGPGKMSAKTVQ